MNALKMAALISLSALALVIPPSPVGSQETGDSGTKRPVITNAPVYRPPLRGAPGGRIGGGTRGTGREVFVLSVLAPDHTGLTVSVQPSLYWFISSLSSFPVELTVVDPRATQPVLEHRIPAPVHPGVHRIRLANYGVRLSLGVPYRWFVAVAPDPGRRSKDILAGGVIERVEIPEGLRARLAGADKAELPFLYAEAGLWYDALTAISELIEAAPQDRVLRRQRAALVAQVGLPEIGEEEPKKPRR